MSEFPISSAPARPEPRRTWPWLVVAIVITALWSFGTSLKGLDEPLTTSDALGEAGAIGYVTGTILGASLFIGGLVWLLLYFGFTRRLARSRGPAHFLVLALTAGIAATPLNALQLAGAMNQADLAPMRGVMDEYATRQEARTDEIRMKRDEILAGGFMEPEVLARPGGLDRARSKLAALRRLSDEALATAAQEAAQARARLAEITPSNRKARVLADFDRGYAEGRAESSGDLALASEAFDAMEGQLDVLSRKPRAWQVEDGQFAFTREADVAAFNAHFAKLQSVGARIRARDQARAAADAAAPKS